MFRLFGRDRTTTLPNPSNLLQVMDSPKHRDVLNDCFESSNISDISRYMKRLTFSPSLRNLIRQSWFERSLLLSWEVAMSTYLVQVVVLSVARLAGTVARKTRRTRTSNSTIGFKQQISSKLRDLPTKRNNR